MPVAGKVKSDGLDGIMERPFIEILYDTQNMKSIFGSRLTSSAPRTQDNPPAGQKINPGSDETP
jgi:hypothetical protein